MFHWRDMYSSFINLDSRKDRLILMEHELKRVGIEAERTPGIHYKKVQGDLSKYQVMIQRTPGALGCHMAQVSVMTKALSLNKSAFVMEDDLVFCSDIQKRLDHIETFLNTHEWDVFWLGGTYHINPPHWHPLKHSSELKQCNCKLGRDAELTDDSRIIRTYGCFSTFAYIVNIESLPKILHLLDCVVHESMGIDWLFIRLQPQLKTYAFAPGCVKQYDNKSDIGKGFTYFSGFKKLGAHWWADTMEQFNPDTYDWKEAKIL